jgi:hypothetical protein
VRGLMIGDAPALTALCFQADDGDEIDIRSTTEHPYWVHGQGWTSAKDVQVGTYVVGDEGLLRVKSNATQVAAVKVYNLEITTDRTYFVSSISQRGPPHGVWVHNNCVLRQSLEQTVRNEAAAAGVQLTDKQVLEAVQELVKRAAARGGKGVLVKSSALTDDSLKFLNRFTDGNPELVKLGRDSAWFQGLVSKNMQKLEHLSEAQLREIASFDPTLKPPALYFQKGGRSPIMPNGERIELHHELQDKTGPIIELPQSLHRKILHDRPGIGDMERELFNKWRGSYWAARARDELVRRGLSP